MCEGNNDVFAFATVLPLSTLKQGGALSLLLGQLQRGIHAIPAGSRSPATTLVLNSISPVTSSSSSSSSPTAAASTTGILLHKRFSNLPLELIAPLHSNLEEDLSWASQSAQKQKQQQGGGKVVGVVTRAGEETEEDGSESFDFGLIDSILLLSVCSLPSSGNGEAGGGKGSKGKDKGKDKSKGKHGHQENNGEDSKGERGGEAEGGGGVVDVTGNASLLFDDFEDEMYAQNAVASVMFRPVSSSKSSGGAGFSLTASLIPVSALPRCVSAINSLVPSSTSNTTSKNEKSP